MAERYLVFDIETYPDKALVRDVYGLSLEELRADLDRRTGSRFLPTIFHIPIVIASIEASTDLDDLSIEVRSSPIEKECELLSAFWDRCNSLAEGSGRSGPRGEIVTFNGTRFDLRVLEQRALKYGLRCNTAFRNPVYHFDIPLFLSGFEGGSRNGLTLQALSKLVDLPGKSLLEGDGVQSTYDVGDLFRISEYCLLDTIQTYLLFLRCMVLQGSARETYERGLRSLLRSLQASQDAVVRGVCRHVEALTPSFAKAN
jgi:predicted PolB exonuclease-like 3'-5' exonuclease